MVRAERGFTYLGLLIAVAIVGIGASAASEVWVTTARRQRLEQLEFVGQQYVQAIGSYYESAPNGRREFPKTVADLLEDKRFAFTRRHLRREYPNPLTGRVDWEYVGVSTGGVRGIKVTWRTEAGAAVREYVYAVQGR